MLQALYYDGLRAWFKCYQQPATSTGVQCNDYIGGTPYGFAHLPIPFLTFFERYFTLLQLRVSVSPRFALYRLFQLLDEKVYKGLVT